MVSRKDIIFKMRKEGDVIGNLCKLLECSEFDIPFSPELLQRSSKDEWLKLFLYLIFRFELRYNPVSVLHSKRKRSRRKKVTKESEKIKISQFDFMVQTLEKWLLKQFLRKNCPVIYNSVRVLQLEDECFTDGSILCGLIAQDYPELIKMEDLWCASETDEEFSMSDSDGSDISLDDSDDGEEGRRKVDSKKVEKVLENILKMFRLDGIIGPIDRILSPNQTKISILINIALLKSQLRRKQTKEEIEAHELAGREIEVSDTSDLKDKKKRRKRLEDALLSITKAIHLAETSSNHYFYLQHILTRAKLYKKMKEYKRSINDFVYYGKHCGFTNIVKSLQDLYFRIGSYKEAKRFYSMEKEMKVRKNEEEKEKSNEKKKSDRSMVEGLNRMIKLCNQGIRETEEIEYMKNDFLSRKLEFIGREKFELIQKFNQLYEFVQVVVEDVFDNEEFETSFLEVEEEGEEEEEKEEKNEKQADEELELESPSPENKRVRKLKGKKKRRYSNPRSPTILKSNVNKNFFSLERLDELRNEIRKKITLFFIGPTKSGKSTTINKLMNADGLLPVSSLPCTSCLTYVHHVDDDRKNINIIAKSQKGGPVIKDAPNSRTERIDIYRKVMNPPTSFVDCHPKTIEKCVKGGDFCSFLATGTYSLPEIYEKVNFYTCHTCEDHFVCCQYCRDHCHLGHDSIQQIPVQEAMERRVFCHCYKFCDLCQSRRENLKVVSFPISEEGNDKWKREVNLKRDESGQVEMINDKAEIYCNSEILKYACFLDSPGVTESPEMLKLVDSRFSGMETDVLVFVFNGISTIDSYWDDFFKRHRAVLQSIENPIVVVGTRLHNYFGDVEDKEAEFRGKLEHPSRFGPGKRFDLFFVEQEMENEEFCKLNFETLLDYRKRFALLKKHLFDIIIEGSFNMYRTYLREYEKEVSKIHHFYSKMLDMRRLKELTHPDFSQKKWRRKKKKFKKKKKHYDEPDREKKSDFEAFLENEEKYLKELKQIVESWNENKDEEEKKWTGEVKLNLLEFWRSRSTFEQIVSIAKNTLPKLAHNDPFDYLDHQRKYDEFLLRVDLLYREYCRRYMVMINDELLREFHYSQREMGKIMRANGYQHYETSFISHGLVRYFSGSNQGGSQNNKPPISSALVVSAILVTPVVSHAFMASLVMDYARSKWSKKRSPYERIAEKYVSNQCRDRVINKRVNQFLSGFTKLWRKKVGVEKMVLECETWFFKKYFLGGRVPEKSGGNRLIAKRYLKEFYTTSCLKYLRERYSLGKASKLLMIDTGITEWKGAYGKVNKCKIISNTIDQDFETLERATLEKAIKIIKPSPPNAGLSSIVQEAFLLSLNKHPNLLSLEYFLCKEIPTLPPRKRVPSDSIGSVSIVTELFEGSLAELLAPRYSFDKRLSLRHALQAIDSIINGMCNLHERGVVHRDLKPGNILFRIRFQDEKIEKMLRRKIKEMESLVDSHETEVQKIREKRKEKMDQESEESLEEIRSLDSEVNRKNAELGNLRKSKQRLERELEETKVMEISICDFGCSKNERQMDCSFKGTPGYAAREVLSMKMYSKSVDVFSFGIILFEMLSRSKIRVPPGAETSKPFEITKSHYYDLERSFGKKGGVGREICSVIKSCVQNVPSRRPSFDEIRVKWNSIKPKIKQYVVIGPEIVLLKMTEMTSKKKEDDDNEEDGSSSPKPSCSSDQNFALEPIVPRFDYEIGRKTYHIPSSDRLFVTLGIMDKNGVREDFCEENSFNELYVEHWGVAPTGGITRASIKSAFGIIPDQKQPMWRKHGKYRLRMSNIVRGYELSRILRMNISSSSSREREISKSMVWGKFRLRFCMYGDDHCFSRKEFFVSVS